MDKAYSDFRKWEKTIPFISFPSHWKVKITPAFGGATIRFQVKKGEDMLSVYLDCDCVLGAMKSPYWEVYPVKYSDYEDVARFTVGQEDEMFGCIESQLNDEIWSHGE